VLSGLTLNDDIVLNPPDSITDGALVRVAATPAPAAAPAKAPARKPS
jgi:hypothetical protein